MNGWCAILTLVASETKWTLIMVPCSEAVAIYIPLEERKIAARGARTIKFCWISSNVHNIPNNFLNLKPFCGQTFLKYKWVGIKTSESFVSTLKIFLWHKKLLAYFPPAEKLKTFTFSLFFFSFLLGHSHNKVVSYA